MTHSIGQRFSRRLFVALALTSPLAALGDSGKLPPVIDLNPRHNEAASSSLEEPQALVVAVEAMPLLGNTNPPAGPIGKPQRDSSAADTQRQPAVRSPLPPVIRVYEPIRPTPTQRPNHSMKAANRGTRPELPTSVLSSVQRPVQRPALEPVQLPTLEPVPERVNRSEIPATRDQRQPTLAPRTQLLKTHDTHSSRRLAAPKSASRSQPAVSTADRIAGQQPSPVSAPRRSGIVQFAAQDPTSSISKLDKTSAPALPIKRAAEEPQKSKPLVTLVTQSPIEARQTETAVATNSDAAPVRAPAPVVSREDALSLAAASSKRSSPDAEPAAEEIIQQLLTAAAPAPHPALVERRETVPESVQLASPERLVPTESVEQLPRLAATARRMIQSDGVEPMLTVVQSSPSASDLPAPVVEPLTEERTAAPEELDGLELDLKSIHELSTCITPEKGELPKNYAAPRFDREGEIAHPMGYSRTQTESLMTWTAPALCYRPLYFQDINLERYGHKVPLVQPALSAAHFFGRVPLLPYMMISEGHFDCRYTLGHYRPGDYAPYSLYIPRLRLDATAAELAVAAGLILALP